MTVTVIVTVTCVRRGVMDESTSQVHRQIGDGSKGTTNSAWNVWRGREGARWNDGFCM